MPPPEPSVVTAPLATARRGAAAVYLELVKPRVSLLVLATTLASYGIAVEGSVRLPHLLATLGGTLLAAAGANCLNQILERHADALMERTRLRPLPSGALSHGEALLFGLCAALGGIGLLLFLVNGLTALLAAVAVLSYALVYTPLKRRTHLCTLVGAVPGALPVVMGATAAAGSVTERAIWLFLLLLFWQLPHFYAIAWIYRHDYRAGGFPMLPVVDASGKRTAIASVTTTLLMIAASVAPACAGTASPWYGAAALLLGGWFLAAVLRFVRDRRERTARTVFRVSVLYLPLVLLALLAERLPSP